MKSRKATSLILGLIAALCISWFGIQQSRAEAPCGFIVCRITEVQHGYYWLNEDKTIVYAQMPAGSTTFAAFTLASGDSPNRVYENRTGLFCQLKHNPKQPPPHITISSSDLNRTPIKGDVTAYGNIDPRYCATFGAPNMTINTSPPKEWQGEQSLTGVSAGSSSGSSDPAGSSDLASNPIIKDINALVKFLSIGIGVIVIIMIILGGIQYSMAGDNPAALTAAKQRIINALIALAAFLLLFAFLQWLIPGGVF